MEITYRENYPELEKEMGNAWANRTNFIIGYSFDDGMEIIPFEDLISIEDQGDEDLHGDNWINEDGGFAFYYKHEKYPGEIILSIFTEFQFIGNYPQWAKDNNIEINIIDLNR